MTVKKKGSYIKQGRPFTAPPVKYKATVEIEDWEFPRLTPYDVNEMIRDALSCYFQVNKVDSEKVKQCQKKSTITKKKKLSKKILENVCTV